jgi:hypothetical protein
LPAKKVFACKKVFDWKLTKRLVTGIELWKLYFQIRARCALMSAFNKIAGKRFFLQSNAFFAVKRFFAGNAFHKKK